MKTFCEFVAGALMLIFAAVSFAVALFFLRSIDYSVGYLSGVASIAFMYVFFELIGGNECK